MTDKEKLEKVRAEIERRFEIYLTGARTPFRNGKCEALRDIISFIDSLQEEPQVKESAKNQHVNETCKENDNSLTQEPVSEDLEEAANKYAKDYLFTPKPQRAPNIHFINGANWQKEQLMAKAVDGKIYETQTRSKMKACTTGYISHFDYRVGEKVKVIIIKED